MELWIRSQDRECLMKIDRVDYDLSNSQHRIMVNGYETLVGHYETKERALEVLDDIQNILMLKQTWDLNENSLKICFEKYNEEDIQTIIKKMEVYEMPKE